MREAWEHILNADPRFTVIASCGDAEEAVQLALQTRPDIVLMDINMAPFSGIEATEKIKKAGKSTQVIGVSMYSKPEFARKILQAGAKGYVTKNSTREEMVQAILEVHQGRKYICIEIKDIISDNVINERADAPNLNLLSEREMQVVNMVRDGASSKEIARALFLSVKTVEVHRHNVLKKLKMRNSASLVNFINSRAAFL